MKRTFLGIPYSMDYGTWGSFFGTPYFGKLPYATFNVFANPVLEPAAKKGLGIRA